MGLYSWSPRIATKRWKCESCEKRVEIGTRHLQFSIPNGKAPRRFTMHRCESCHSKIMSGHV